MKILLKACDAKIIRFSALLLALLLPLASLASCSQSACPPVRVAQTGRSGCGAAIARPGPVARRNGVARRDHLQN